MQTAHEMMIKLDSTETLSDCSVQNAAASGIQKIHAGGSHAMTARIGCMQYVPGLQKRSWRHTGKMNYSNAIAVEIQILYSVIQILPLV